MVAGIHYQPSEEAAKAHSEQRVDRFPKSFQRATWRGAIPGGGTDDMGVSFDLPSGETIRLRIPDDHAKKLADSIHFLLARKRSQSSTSSGSPQVEVSIPDEGQSE